MEARQRGEALVRLNRARRLAFAKGRVELAVAAAGAVLVGDGNVDEGSDEADVKQDGQKGRQRVAGEAA